MDRYIKKITHGGLIIRVEQWIMKEKMNDEET